MSHNLLASLENYVLNDNNMHSYIFICDINIQLLQSRRKIGFKIENLSQSTLENPHVYFKAGKSNDSLPFEPLLNSKCLVWTAKKTAYAPRGTAGVIVYQIKEHNLSLVVMWSLPFLYGIGHKNWWNVKVIRGSKTDKGNIPNSDFVNPKFYDRNTNFSLHFGIRIVQGDAQWSPSRR